MQIMLDYIRMFVCLQIDKKPDQRGSQRFPFRFIGAEIRLGQLHMSGVPGKIHDCCPCAQWYVRHDMTHFRNPNKIILHLPLVTSHLCCERIPCTNIWHKTKVINHVKSRDLFSKNRIIASYPVTSKINHFFCCHMRLNFLFLFWLVINKVQIIANGCMMILRKWRSNGEKINCWKMCEKTKQRKKYLSILICYAWEDGVVFFCLGEHAFSLLFW